MLRTLLYLACLLHTSSPGKPPLGRPIVLAHYMPWFQANPAARQWGWHWTMNAFDPGRTVDGKQSIASHYHPLIGAYDSGDPAVIEYHLLLMKLAGIDGVVIDWYGLSALYDYPLVHSNARALAAAAGRLGMRFAVCYEDQTISKQVEQKRITAADRVSSAVRDLDWVAANWFSLPNYLRSGGKPVLLSFGFSGLTDDEWHQALGRMSTTVLYLTEGIKRSAAQGAFDWPQPQAGLAAADKFDRSVAGGTVSIPVVFPGFDDVYKAAGVQPGYPRVPDGGGRTFTTTLGRAASCGATIMQIATWNDWGEGTQIEPSLELGYRDLEALQQYRRSVDPSFHAETTDLRMPLRIWQLRGREAAEPALKARLDRVVRSIAAGDVRSARGAMSKL